MTREEEEEEEEGGRDGKESREEGCMFCEFSSRRNGQRKREWKGGIKKKYVAPIILKHLRGC